MSDTPEPTHAELLDLLADCLAERMGAKVPNGHWQRVGEVVWAAAAKPVPAPEPAPEPPARIDDEAERLGLVMSDEAIASAARIDLMAAITDEIAKGRK